MPPKSDKPAAKELISDDAARGVELAVTPLLFGALGWLLDAWLGTGPWLAIALGTFAVVGTIAKMWYGYDAEMRDLESRSRWARRSGSAPAADTGAPTDLWADRKAAS